MKKSILKIVICFMVVTLIYIPISAESLNTAVYEKISFSKTQMDTTLEIPSGIMNQRSNYISGELVFSNTSTINEQGDLYIFSVQSPKAVVFKVESTNPNVVMQFCIVDLEAGTAQPTSVYHLAGGEKEYYILDGVPAGYYAFYVYAIDDMLGDAYTIRVNAANPSGYVGTPLKISSDLSIVTMQYSNSVYYSNGVNPLTQPVKYIREDSWPIEGGVQWVNHQIDYGVIRNVEYGAFTSRKNSSDNVLKIDLDVGTLWTFWTQVYMWDGTGGSSFIDAIGLTTPRYLGNQDIYGINQFNYLIYDLNTNEYIYFDSLLNWFHVAEEPSFITAS